MPAKNTKSKKIIPIADVSAANRLPPQNIEAEQALLGSLMLDKDAIVKIENIVRPDDFYKNHHAEIFRAMVELYGHREPIDILSLTNKLEEQNLLEQIGGSAYLANLVNSVPSAASVAYYAKIIQKKSVLRRLINTAGQILTLGYDENEEVDNLLDEAEQLIFGISQKYLNQSFLHIKPILNEAFDRIDRLHQNKGEFRGIATGFKDLDIALNGLQKSDLIILASRPSLGKTSLALDIARYVSTQGKKAVGVFSLEMSKEQLIDRLLCAEAKVDLRRLRSGTLSSEGENDEFSRLSQAMDTLAAAPIYIDDAGSNNVMAMRAMARRLQGEVGLDLLIIDYLQLMQRDREQRYNQQDNRVQELGEITRSLKALAKELNIPIIAISQLSRAVESRPGQEPRLSDLRESGTIEQDSDVVLLIYREDRVKDNSDKNVADIIIAKHRNGPVGRIKLYFREERASFEGYTNKFSGYNEYVNSQDYKDLTTY
ncbi:replicative DNA helicase [Patescibacteria group bacterium]|nr:replicative DNA helicase [Patescibacteria group bacterium]MBU4000336.1 replicative DNA helicase [Patescibacteria group bacterium]MBU4056484.1 replicative DNA helicase [Patescibacteria group bacterium]MBU4368713.1 replicative DNA helicase [Patescibacteria group bacterium]